MKNVPQGLPTEPPPRIMVLNDEPSLLEAIETMLRAFLTDAAVLSLQDSRTAWDALTRTDPDLLIIDDKMPSLTGEEICKRLLARGATYPIIVHSRWEPTEQWVLDFASRGLSAQFLECPFELPDFRKVLEAGLKTPYYRRCEQ